MPYYSVKHTYRHWTTKKVKEQPWWSLERQIDGKVVIYSEFWVSRKRLNVPNFASAEAKTAYEYIVNSFKSTEKRRICARYSLLY